MPSIKQVELSATDGSLGIGSAISLRGTDSGWIQSDNEIFDAKNKQTFREKKGRVLPAE